MGSEKTKASRRLESRKSKIPIARTERSPLGKTQTAAKARLTGPTISGCVTKDAPLRKTVRLRKLDSPYGLSRQSLCWQACPAGSRGVPEGPLNRVSRSRQGPGEPRDGPLERRGAGRWPNGGEPFEPGGIEVGRGLRVHHGATPLPAEIDEFSRVVRVPASHDDGVHPLQQPPERSLVFLGRQADRVDVPDLGVRVSRGECRTWEYKV